ncbi:InlB B-repeat-containing protein [Methanomethylophilus alvi]|uniref:InlB B-repeat-containing protein n=1 Tax=Methanomethylophilus alvi TaxID=1291540 RepID=UPI0037DC8EBF
MATSLYTLSSADGSDAEGEGYLVSFDVCMTGDGSPATPYSMRTDAYGSLTSSLPRVECDGYVFNGWYDADGKRIRVNNVFTEDTTVYAHWTRTSSDPIVVLFVINMVGDVTPASPAGRLVLQDGTLGTLPEPSFGGFTFTGWYTDAECLPEQRVSTSMHYSSDTMLYAGWDADSVSSHFTVSFKSCMNGLDDPADIGTGDDARAGDLPVLYRGGKVFEGWYTSNGLEVTHTTVFTSDVVVYAHWSDKEKDWVPILWALLISVFLLAALWRIDGHYRHPLATVDRIPTASEDEIRRYQTACYADIAERQGRVAEMSFRVKALSDRRRVGTADAEEEEELSALRGRLEAEKEALREVRRRYNSEMRTMYGIDITRTPLIFYEVRVLLPAL